MASQIVIIRFKVHSEAPGVCGPDSKAMIWQVRSGARIWVAPHATVTATGSGTEGPVITDEPGPLLVVSIVAVTISALLIWAPSFCWISSGPRLALTVRDFGRVIVSSKPDLACPQADLGAGARSLARGSSGRAHAASGHWQ